MKKILVNAYAVSPGMGSEPGMGWNWCVHMALDNELFILTEGEFKDKIEMALKTLPQGRNMHFYYLPVSERIRKMCWSQGDWRFYWHYRKWQKQALSLAREVCRRERVDVIHQLNMVGFREPGFLWKIPGIRYVWGPVGGMSQVPMAFFRDASLSIRWKMLLKNALNFIQMRCSPRVRMAAARADAIICATADERERFRKWFDKPLPVIPETGLEQEEVLPRLPAEDGRFHIVWAGRFVPRKQLGLALRILAQLDPEDIVLDVLGYGTLEEETRCRALADELGVSGKVVWHGAVPHAEVIRRMRSSQLFLFTSVHEVTSTVIMEAISTGLPIVCFDACGFGPIVDETVGRKLPCVNPELALRDFTATILRMYYSPEERAAMGAGGRERLKLFTWYSKMQQLNQLYGE